MTSPGAGRDGTSSGSPASPAKAAESVCTVCRKPMPSGARLCTECGCYQSPFIRLIQGSNIQSLVAVVPLLAIVGVFLKDQLVSHGSELHVSAMQCTRQEIELAVSNLGDRAAILKGVEAGLVLGSGNPSELLPLRRSSGEKDSPILEPTKTVLLSYETVDPRGERFMLPRGPAGGADCRYRVDVSLVAFDHQPEKVELTCPCPD